nr:MAG TPA: hypothetical protein [Caudoviricetes sp.]
MESEEQLLCLLFRVPRQRRLPHRLRLRLAHLPPLRLRHLRPPRRRPHCLFRSV